MIILLSSESRPQSAEQQEEEVVLVVAPLTTGREIPVSYSENLGIDLEIEYVSHSSHPHAAWKLQLLRFSVKRHVSYSCGWVFTSVLLLHHINVSSLKSPAIRMFV